MNTHQPITRKGRKYEQVLEGAREVFLRDGFEGASVDEIARTSGVSKATLYSYFPDKREMFMAMARLQCDRHAEAMMQEINIEAPAREVLTQAARGVLQLTLSGFGLKVFRICVAEADRFPELGRQFYETGPAMARQRIAAFLQLATQRGELRVEDYDMAAAQFQALCRADLFMRRIFGIKDQLEPNEVERIVEETITTFMARYGV